MLLNISLADLLSQNTSTTALALQAATIYEDKILFTEKKSPGAEKWCAGVSSQGKYILARLTHTVCYEVHQACN